MDFTHKLRLTKRGDEPSSGQQNLLVRNAKRMLKGKGVVRNSQAELIRAIPAQDFKLFFLAKSVITKGCAVELYDKSDGNVQGVTYMGRQYVADNTPEALIVIAERAAGVDDPSYAYLNRPVEALVQAAASIDPGISVGPKNGELELQQNYPGFMYLGPTGEGYHHVVQTFQPTFGYGTTVAGQTGQPANILVNPVNFVSGINCWDGTSDLSIANVFGDTVADNLLVHFRWNMVTGQFEVTDIECPPTP